MPIDLPRSFYANLPLFEDFIGVVFPNFLNDGENWPNKIDKRSNFENVDKFGILGITLMGKVTLWPRLRKAGLDKTNIWYFHTWLFR